MFAIVGLAIFTTQYLQSVLGMSPLEAALWALVPSVPSAWRPRWRPPWSKGFNRAYVVAAGFAIGACGYALLALADADSLWWYDGAGLLACGMVMVISQIMDLAMSSVPPERAGSASALMETGAEFGGALGMAVLGCIGTAVYRHDIAGLAPAAAHETLGGALAVASQLPGRTGDALATAAREAFTSGMQGAAIAGTVLLIGAAALAARALKGIRVDAG